MKVENLSETLQKSRPKAKPSTIKMYEANLNKLKKIFDTDNYDFLKNVDKVMEKLEGKHFTTIKNYVNSIVILLLALNSEGEFDTLLEKYDDERLKLTKMYEDSNATNKISEKQKVNFAPFEEVVDMTTKMASELKGWKKKELSAKQKTLLQVYMVYMVHLQLPMRNELAGMEAITKRKYNSMSIKDKEEGNWLVMEKNKMFMSLNEYKTQKTYKEITFPVPKDLEKLLRAYIRKFGMGVLLKSSTGKPLTRNQLSQLLLKFSQKYIGKKVSTTMLRKIVLSHKFSEVNEEKKKMANIMAHSTDIADKVYVKEA